MPQFLHSKRSFFEQKGEFWLKFTEGCFYGSHWQYASTGTENGRTGDKPLSELTMAKFTDAYMRHSVSIR